MRVKLSDWRLRFSMDNLEAGEKAYKNDQIFSVEKQNNVYKILIEDLYRDYEVEVKEKGDNLTLDCSCGKANKKGSCSHLVTALNLLENPNALWKEIIEEENKKEAYNLEQLRIALEKLDKEKLIEKILLLAKEDEKAAKIFYRPRRPKKDSFILKLESLSYDEKYKILKQKFISAVKQIIWAFSLYSESYEWVHYGYHGYINFDALGLDLTPREYKKRQNEDLKKIKYYLKIIHEQIFDPDHLIQATEFVVDIIKIISEKFKGDEGYFLEEEITDRLVDYLDEIFEENPDQTNNEDLKAIYQEIIKSDTSFDDLKFLLEDYLFNEEERNRNELKEITSLLEEDINSSDLSINHLLRAVELMKELNYSSDEIEEFVKPFKNNINYLEYEFNRAYENQEYDKAERFLNQLMSYPNNYRNYDFQAIDLYEKSGNNYLLIESIKRVLDRSNRYRSGLKEGKELQELLIKLKSLLKPEEWIEYRNNFLEKSHKTIFEFIILCEDGLLDKALNLYFTEGFLEKSFPNKYIEKLAQEQPERFINQTVNTINKFMKIASGREDYSVLRDKLFSLKDLPGGKEAINQTIDELVLKYPRRTAMKEILYESLKKLE